MSDFNELPDKIKSRLMGALNLANQSENAGEAAAASARVQEMLFKYNISLSSVVSELDSKNTRIKFAGMATKRIVFAGVNRDKMVGRLAAVLGKYMFVKTVWTTVQDANNPAITFNAILFAGKETDVDMVMALFDKLRFALNKMANKAHKEYKAAGGNIHGGAWKNDFWFGAVNGIGIQMRDNYELFQQTRYMKLDGEIASVGEMGPNTVTGREIIVKSETAMAEYVAATVGETYKIPGQNKMRDVNAVAQGYQAGKNMEINSRIG